MNELKPVEEFLGVTRRRIVRRSATPSDKHEGFGHGSTGAFSIQLRSLRVSGELIFSMVTGHANQRS
jgi:hypothetical protein